MRRSLRHMLTVTLPVHSVLTLDIELLYTSYSCSGICFKLHYIQSSQSTRGRSFQLSASALEIATPISPTSFWRATSTRSAGGLGARCFPSLYRFLATGLYTNSMKCMNGFKIRPIGGRQVKWNENIFSHERGRGQVPTCRTSCEQMSYDIRVGRTVWSEHPISIYSGVCRKNVRNRTQTAHPGAPRLHVFG
ncbi:hypothetical protein BDN67DRAFT_403620 [Paxillus ammoniavirescens]|nr:hypothetical protein BDN67DRAFT_403620 [Paxillus ammoniavirescens]